MKLLTYPGLFVLLIGWGLLVGLAFAAAAWYRVIVALKLPRTIERARTQWMKFLLRQGHNVYIVGCLWLLGSAYVLVPYLFLQWTFGCKRCPFGREALWTVGLASLLPVLLYLPRARRRRRVYVATHTATCGRCGRVNDRPTFAGHHQYFVLCGFAAKMVDGGYACRWCAAPLRFPGP